MCKSKKYKIIDKILVTNTHNGSKMFDNTNKLKNDLMFIVLIEELNLVNIQKYNFDNFDIKNKPLFLYYYQLDDTYNHF